MTTIYNHPHISNEHKFEVTYHSPTPTIPREYFVLVTTADEDTINIFLSREQLLEIYSKIEQAINNNPTPQ